MTVFIFGAGPLGRYLSESLTNRGFGVCLLSSTHEIFSTKSVSCGIKSYGEILSTDLSSTNNLAIFTTRIDLVSPEVKSRILKDLVYLVGAESHVLNFSSVAVYGSNPLFRKESHGAHPVNDYGKSKLQIEHDLLDLGSPQLITNLRISNLFGLCEFKDFTNTVIQKLTDSENLRMPYSKTFRDFVHISDLLSFIEYWVNSPQKFGGVLNFSSGYSIGLDEWALIIARTLKKDLAIDRNLHESYSDSFIDNSSVLSIWPYKFSDQKTLLVNYVNPL